jgi:hypothetical protein
MLFRSQHAWLLLGAISSFFSFLFPFYRGTAIQNNIAGPINILASSHPGTFILSAALTVGCLLVIFVNKDPGIQGILVVALLLISILNIIIYFKFINHFQKGSGAISFSAIFSFLIPICIFIAAKKIRQDERFRKRSSSRVWQSTVEE